MSVSTLLPLLLMLAVVTAGYLGTCALFPFRACPRCQGGGTRSNPVARATFRMCPRCEGTGRQVRPGRRVYEYLAGKDRIDHFGRTR